MKNKRVMMWTLAALLAFVGLGCGDGELQGTPTGNENNVNSSGDLVGTKWKLEGIVDVKTKDLKILVPENCNECYTLTFDSDTLFLGHGTVNRLSGRYNVDYATGDIYTFVGLMTEIYDGGVTDENLYVEIFNTVYRFTSQNNELRLYFNEQKYLRFKQQGEADNTKPDTGADIQDNNISACGVNDPLQNIEWLKEYSECFDDVQHISSVRIDLYKTIDTDEHIIKIGFSYSDPNFSCSGSMGWRNCNSDYIFGVSFCVPPRPGVVEDFLKDKEFVAELFHCIKQ